MARSSIRTRLLFVFVLVVGGTGAGTMILVENRLAEDLVTVLDARLSKQASAIANQLTAANHPHNLTIKLGAAAGVRVTVVGSDGLIQADSVEADTIGRPIGDAPEIAWVRKHGGKHRAIRQLHYDTSPEYMIAVPAALDRVVRLSVPIDDINRTRARMRNRLLGGFGAGVLGSLVLGVLLIRAITRPLASMTRTAERMAEGDYAASAPTKAGGEMGVLANAMNKMAAEIRARIGELTEQRDMLSTVFGEMVEGVIVIDDAGKVVMVNAAAKPLVGDGPLPQGVQALVERALAGEEADGELELVGRVVRASARKLPDTRDAIVVLYDVTRIRALENIRREFLSNVAHELRTPVTSISGYAETLLGAGDTIDAELRTEFLQTIHRNAQRIAGLVSDLLVLDTLEARDQAVGERVPIALAQVAKDAAKTTRGAIPTADVEIAIAPALAVLGTRVGLDHVIQNLVDNAVKYAKTKVVVAASVIAPGRVRLTVSDRGPGIPVGQEERVFERFYRLDAGRSSDRGGSGLGLAIVKSQVEAMGGTIRVEQNEPGARFVVELDAAPDATTDPDATQGESS